MRGWQVYYDDQQGTFFWVDLGQQAYSGGVPWVHPTPSAGLLQLMDENQVSAYLWALSAHPDNPDDSIGANKVFLDALRSPRMLNTPFARGYHWHTWDFDQNATCGAPTFGKSNVQDTGQSIPMLADYLDALVCIGAPPSLVDGALQTSEQYPFPSYSAICQ